MKLLRYVIVIVQICAITLYPQMVQDASAAALHKNLPKVASPHDGHHTAHSGHWHHNVVDADSGEKASELVAEDSRSNPISGPVEDDPCCNVGGGICATIISEGPKVPRQSDSCDFEIIPSAPLAEVDSSLLPHPPKTSA